MAEIGPSVVAWPALSACSTSVRRKISCLSSLLPSRPLLLSTALSQALMYRPDGKHELCSTLHCA